MSRLCLTHGTYEKRQGHPGCPACTAERSAARGNPSNRGIGPNHRAMADLIKRDHLPCTMCHQPYGDFENPIWVGHVVARVNCRAIGKDPDDPANLRPECRRCNLRKGAG